jgi:hypothetical protein
MDHHSDAGSRGQLVTARLLLFAAALAGAVSLAGAADPPVGRLFFTPAERAALENARRRNIRAEELAAEAAKRPAAPRARSVIVSGVVQRSDGESFAWVNGKSVEGQTGDGLRVRHTAQPNRVVVYDPDKGRMVQVKVGQRADLTTGQVEENYERRKREPQTEAAVSEPDLPSASVPRRKPRAARNAEDDGPSEPPEPADASQ